ncbi:hypothetical protein [Mycobacteroides abscessus]|uniref:hypothetical protein n=1 Tax=Mycobacteroides abscessus TaxID=36809 RepID=UPI000C2614CB|nr:hypothetical protein [Mycobacteroides abscessus]
MSELITEAHQVLQGLTEGWYVTLDEPEVVLRDTSVAAQAVAESYDPHVADRFLVAAHTLIPQLISEFQWDRT